MHHINSSFSADNKRAIIQRGRAHLRAFAVLLVFTMVNTSLLNAADSSSSDSVSVYRTHENEMLRVDRSLQDAIDEQKYLLLILGAQWCHDSQGFAAKMQHPDVKKAVEKSFKPLFVDVAYYKDHRQITRRFGYPSVFGTPTVLVIDPTSEQLVNLDSLTRFNNADSMPVTDYVSYFTDFKPRIYTHDSEIISATDLETFEREQTQRLADGYARLAPYLRAKDQGNLADETPFRTLWGQVRDFRFQLQKDIHALRMGDRQTLPVYEPQAWE